MKVGEAVELDGPYLDCVLSDRVSYLGARPAAAHDPGKTKSDKRGFDSVAFGEAGDRTRAEEPT